MLPVSTSSQIQTNWKRPQSLSPNDSIFKYTEGVTVGSSHLEFDCGNLNYISIGLFDLDYTNESFNKILKILYPKSKYVEGPFFQLPIEYKSYEVIDSPKSTSSSDEKIFVVITPDTERGLLTYIYVGVDEDFAKTSISSFGYDGILYKYLVSSNGDSVNVLGKKFWRHRTCKWEGARNISAYPNGQMNWSVYSSLEKANEGLKRQLDGNRKFAKKILSEDSIKVEFLGKSTNAIALKLETSFSLTENVLLGGTNVLYVYYIATEINGNYVHWVGSFYEGQGSHDKLPALLYQVLKVL